MRGDFPYVGQTFELQRRLLEPDNPAKWNHAFSAGAPSGGRSAGGGAGCAHPGGPYSQRGFPATRTRFVVETQVALARTLLAGQQNLETGAAGESRRSQRRRSHSRSGAKRFRRSVYYRAGHSLARQHRFDEALQQHRPCAWVS